MCLDDLPQAREHEIRRIRQIIAVQPKSIAKPVSGLPDAHLRLGARLADAAHVSTARLGRQVIRHRFAGKAPKALTGRTIFDSRLGTASLQTQSAALLALTASGQWPSGPADLKPAGFGGARAPTILRGMCWDRDQGLLGLVANYGGRFPH